VCKKKKREMKKAENKKWEVSNCMNNMYISKTCQRIKCECKK